MPVQVDDKLVTLSNGSDSVTIALHGASVVSYKANGREQLFVSSKSDLAGPDAIRGGVPICWPVFGPPPKDDVKYNKMKQHGIARIQKWTYQEKQSSESSDGAVAVFTLQSSPETQEVYAPAFQLTYTVALRPTHLNCTLKVDSPSSSSASDEPVEFQAALHTYFRLPEGVKPTVVSVKGLQGLEILDKVGPNAPEKKQEERAVVAVDGPNGEVDRVYFGAPSELEISFPNDKREKIVMTSRGFPDAVLWNPGPKKGATIADMHEGGWDEYVCLESARVRDWIKLAPGESWEGSMTVKPTSD